MDTSSTIRIVSDLHLAHRACLVSDPEQVAPLLEGARTVVFNGDTAELSFPSVRQQAFQMLDELKVLCQRVGCRPIFLNGNHDPDISDHNHFILANQGVLVFHGHTLFPSITPWSRDAKVLEKIHQLELAKRGHLPNLKMADRLDAARSACRIFLQDTTYDHSLTRGWLRHLVHEMLNPSRALVILRNWRRTPVLAADFARLFLPQAKVVVIGHTHLPGHWCKSGVHVVNTGGFLPGPGRRLIELAGKELRIRKVVRADGRYHPGEVLLRLDIDMAASGFSTTALS